MVAFRRFWGVFVLIVAACVIAGILAVALSDRLYVATAQISLDAQRVAVAPQGDPVPPTLEDDALVDSEVELMRSDGLASRVIDRLGLLDDREFGGDGSQASRYRVMTALRNSVQVARLNQTSLIQINATSRDPSKAAELANAYAKTYVDARLELKTAAARQADRILTGELARVSAQLRAATQAADRYRVAKGLIGSQGGLAEQELANINQQVTLAQAEHASARARLETARRQLAQNPSGEDLGETLDSPVIQTLRTQRAAVSGRMAELETRYGQRHPAYVQTKQQLADLDRSIAAEVERITSNLDAQANIAASRAATLAGRSSALKSDLAANTQASAQLRELENQEAQLRNQYELLFARQQQVSLAAETAGSDAVIVSLALPPQWPSSPNIPLTLLFSATAGVLLATAAVLTLDRLRPRLRTIEDLEQTLQVPFLGAVPRMKQSRKRPDRRELIDLVVTQPRSHYAESLRVLWTSAGDAADIATTPAEVTGRSLMVTSCLPGDGKTVLAISLARVLAADGMRTVLVDGDVRRRTASGLLPMRELILRDLDADEDTLAAAVGIDEATGLHLLSLAGGEGTDEPRPDELARMLRALERRYTAVVVDAPPVIPSAFARVLAQQATAVLVLIRWGATPVRLAQVSLGLLQRAGARIVGAAYTQSPSRSLIAGEPGYYDSQFKAYYSET